MALLTYVITACSVEGPVTPVHHPRVSIYISTSSEIMKYSYDEDTSEASILAATSSSFIGKPVIYGDDVLVPTNDGYLMMSGDLSESTNVDLGFSPRMLVPYNDEVAAVAESSILFEGTIVEFDDPIGDVKPGPDGLYVASGKKVFTLPGKVPAMSQATQTISAIAVDYTASVYIGVSGAVLTYLGSVPVDGDVKKMVLNNYYLYVLTNIGNIYRIDVNDIDDVKGCSANISDFSILGDKIFYVSNFDRTFGVYDIDSCEEVYPKTIPGVTFLGIVTKGE